MNARIQPYFSSIASIDIARVDSALRSSRTKFILAQAFMVVGYLALIVNPFEGDAMMIGMLCQCVALLVYCWSKQPTDEVSREAATRTIR
jgi:hypothetical protein